MSAGLGREDIRALLDDLSAELAAGFPAPLRILSRLTSGKCHLSMRGSCAGRSI